MAHTLINRLLHQSVDIVAIDGGARNGPKDLPGLEPLCQFHCFEPNPAELDGVSGSVASVMLPAPADKGVHVYPFALCETSGQTTLNISLRPGSTSTLEPDVELLQRFKADHFSEMEEIIERVKVPAISLHEFMQQSGLKVVDFIKLDTQGNELDILKSAGEYLACVSVIMTEVEMIPLYKDQALFHDVTSFLETQGFELVDLRSTPTCRRFHARSDLPPSAYRLVWGDAIYARTPADATKPRALQQGLVLAGLGYADMAIDLFDRNPTLNGAEKAQLEQFARWAAEPQWHSGKIRRVLERRLGLLMQRYDWRKGHQVASRKAI